MFAELQSGDPAQGDAALGATLRGFAAVAGRAPFAEWPRRFWTMLLAAPALRTAVTPRLRDGPLAVLAGLGGGPRAALLLRLVAGLSEADAAAVLGIARPTYRLALQRALPRTDDDRLDAELWRAMGNAAGQAIRDVPAERIRALSSGPGALRPAPGRQAPVPGARRGWVWPATVVVALLTALALAATWLAPDPFASSDEDGPRIRTQALPPVATTPTPYDQSLELLTHRDLEQLLDAGQGDPAPLDPAFDAWLVAALDVQPDALRAVD
ncbi:hypothetical protein E2F46_02850 [Luteimonas aestuarii]|uniref:RNA polymerase sigma factor 70 region 4 type 2 domain-containing protein n=1 Tax=Luteimonas aestuarii TaxID=453837 RepID=A0A4R5U0U4_9GAMM|nr:sigma factor-like helix-turn-helix DNA-binding protein [Luteimonas aestuarii]TDK27167.1 hypothetical protein E2F46_02850 [Luteimonas aestuarii]